MDDPKYACSNPKAHLVVSFSAMAAKEITLRIMEPLESGGDMLAACLAQTECNMAQLKNNLRNKPQKLELQFFVRAWHLAVSKLDHPPPSRVVFDMSLPKADPFRVFYWKYPATLDDDRKILILDPEEVAQHVASIAFFIRNRNREVTFELVRNEKEERPEVMKRVDNVKSTLFFDGLEKKLKELSGKPDSDASGQRDPKPAQQPQTNKTQQPPPPAPIPPPLKPCKVTGTCTCPQHWNPPPPEPFAGARAVEPPDFPLPGLGKAAKSGERLTSLLRPPVEDEKSWTSRTFVVSPDGHVYHPNTRIPGDKPPPPRPQRPREPVCPRAPRKSDKVHLPRDMESQEREEALREEELLGERQMWLEILESSRDIMTDRYRRDLCEALEASSASSQATVVVAKPAAAGKEPSAMLPDEIEKEVQRFHDYLTERDIPLQDRGEKWVGVVPFQPEERKRFEGVRSELIVAHPSLAQIAESADDYLRETPSLAATLAAEQAKRVLGMIGTRVAEKPAAAAANPGTTPRPPAPPVSDGSGPYKLEMVIREQRLRDELACRYRYELMEANKVSSLAPLKKAMPPGQIEREVFKFKDYVAKVQVEARGEKWVGGLFQPEELERFKTKLQELEAGSRSYGGSPINTRRPDTPRAAVWPQPDYRQGSNGKAPEARKFSPGFATRMPPSPILRPSNFPQAGAKWEERREKDLKEHRESVATELKRLRDIFIKRYGDELRKANKRLERGFSPGPNVATKLVSDEEMEKDVAKLREYLTKIDFEARGDKWSPTPGVEPFTPDDVKRFKAWKATGNLNAIQTPGDTALQAGNPNTHQPCSMGEVAAQNRVQEARIKAQNAKVAMGIVCEAESTREDVKKKANPTPKPKGGSDDTLPVPAGNPVSPNLGLSQFDDVPAMKRIRDNFRGAKARVEAQRAEAAELTDELRQKKHAADLTMRLQEVLKQQETEQEQKAPQKPEEDEAKPGVGSEATPAKKPVPKKPGLGSKGE